jgi:hypothetical protein
MNGESHTEYASPIIRRFMEDTGSMGLGYGIADIEPQTGPLRRIALHCAAGKLLE